MLISSNKKLLGVPGALWGSLGLGYFPYMFKSFRLYPGSPGLPGDSQGPPGAPREHPETPWAPKGPLGALRAPQTTSPVRHRRGARFARERPHLFCRQPLF